MSRCRTLPVLALAFVLTFMLSGCAMLGGAKSPSAPAPAVAAPAPDPPAASPGVRIEIDAPAPLKALLERYLDLVRLGRIARDDVDATEWSRLVDAAPGQVRELLQTEGYFAPVIHIERTPASVEGEPDRVRLQVVPGQRVRVGRVNLEVEGELERAATGGDRYAIAALARLRAAWPLASGKEFRNADWSSAKAETLAALRAAGYVNALWNGTAAQVDTERNEVRLFLVADSGPLFRYGQMEIEGLVAQDSQTVANLLATPRGAPVTETLLLDFQERLQKSGLFESVTVTLDPEPTSSAAARILVRLREAPLQAYTFGVGVSANTGPRASVEHIYRRVFGFAASSHNKIEVGKKHQYWNGELTTHPDSKLYRTLLGATIESLESDSDTVQSQRVRFGRTQDTRRFERFYFVEAERSSRKTIAGDRADATAFTLNYHGVRRELDSIILPTRGYTFAGQSAIGYSYGTDADRGVFTRLYGRLTGYLPFADIWHLQGRLEVGQVFLRDGMVVPELQKFRVGGDDSIRGYGYRSIGPLVNGAVSGGTSMFTSSIELARPFLDSMPSLWGAVFIDAGQAANQRADLKPVLGYGVGVRWRSPVGPLRVDWAWADETGKGRFHFSVGIAF